jgi:guanine deaminase
MTRRPRCCAGSRGRLLYCVTPRFATSSPAQLDAGALWREHPGTYRNRIAENRAKSWVGTVPTPLAPDVYDHHGALGPRSIYGHGIWLSERELALPRDRHRDRALPHLEYFPRQRSFSCTKPQGSAQRARGALTDIAGGRFSMLATMHEAYKIAQLNGQSLTAAQAFYLATRRALSSTNASRQHRARHGGRRHRVDKSTPLIARRMAHCCGLTDALFVQMTLGDERAVRATYIAGRLAYDRDGSAAFGLLE